VRELRTIVGRAWLGGERCERVKIEIAGGKIASVAPWTEKATEDTTSLVLQDEQVLISGFHDAHLHLLTGGLQLSQINLTGAHSVQAVQERLRGYVERERPGAGDWVLGYGLEQTEVSVSRLDLDKVCPDSPVFLWTHDLHSCVVNSRALILCDVHAMTKAPEGGTIARGADGKLNGILREHAIGLVQDRIPKPSGEQCRAAFHRAQEYALSLGITAASASVRSDLLPHYLDLADSERQIVRLNIWKVTESFDLEEDRFERRDSDKFRYACFKGFADGALGSRTAAMWKPYDDDATNSGTLLVREGPLARFVRAAHKDGYQIAMHAIGDRANSVVLDAYEMASSGGLGPELRPRIEHCQILRERDVERFVQLGVVASVQPIHMVSDMLYVEKRIGVSRARYSYAWGSLLRAGATLAFGSDWPIESADPIAGMDAAVNRVGGWNPHERISVADALTAYTRGAAYAAHWEDKMGTIETGKLADFCVLSLNPLALGVSEGKGLWVEATVVGGRVVWVRNELPNN
jgi:predicted amidohydrolase YtcJ